LGQYIKDDDYPGGTADRQLVWIKFPVIFYKPGKIFDDIPAGFACTARREGDPVEQIVKKMLAFPLQHAYSRPSSMRTKTFLTFPPVLFHHWFPG
jgi:hypothetical protein